MGTVRDSSPIRIAILLTCILCLAAALRFYDLGGPDLQWDELLALHRASMPVPELLRSLNNQSASDVFQDTSPPLHHLAIHVATLFGDDNFTVRVPSVLFGLASLFMLFLVGRQFFNARTGLYCALYGALLQFHVAYSRYMRWYVFFYAFSLLSLYCYRRLLERRTVSSALQYGLTTALMLYSSYIAAPFVLAQMLFTAGMCAVCCLDRDNRREAWRLAKVHGLGLVAAGLLYLPQAKGQLVAFMTFYRSGGNAFDPYRVGKAFREMSLYFRDSDFSGTGIVVLFMAIGLIRPWKGKTRTDLPLLLVWCLLPTLVTFFVNVQTQITAKYLVGLYYAMLLLTAAGVDRFSRWMAGQFLPPGRQWARALAIGAGMVVVVLLCGPNLQYAALYRGWQHTSSNWAGYLLTNKQDVDYVMFEFNRAKKVVLTRELRDAYRYFNAITDHRYKKFFYLAQQGGYVPPGLVLVRHMPQSEEVVDFFRGAVVSQAPIVVHPGREGRFSFVDDFTALRFYETVWEAQNVAPDYNLHALAQYSLDEPGQATWKLVPASGVHCREIAVHCDVALRYKIRHMQPDARVRLFAGHDPQHLSLIEDVDFSRIVAANPQLRDPGAAVATSTLSLRATLPWADPAVAMYVRLAFTSGRYVAYMDVSRLGFDVACASAGPTRDPALAALANIAANNRIVPWTPGVERLGGDVLHVFAPDASRTPAQDAGGASWQSAADLALFQAAHPDLPPVAVVPDQNGAPAFYVYDPRLARSAVALAEGREQAVAIDGDMPWAVRGLSYSGTASRPAVDLGDQTLAIPVAVPEGAVVQINPGRTGLVSFNPLFTPDGFDLYNMIFRDNLHVANNTLTCLEDRPCTAQYAFASELPIKGLRATVYPALKTDRPNYARLFYGINDIDARHTFLEFSERGPLDVSSTYEGVVREVRFEKGVNILFVGCELSGRGATLHSDEKYPMRLEVLLDATSFPALDLKASPVSMRLEAQKKSALSLWLSDSPLPLERAWKQ